MASLSAVPTAVHLDESELQPERWSVVLRAALVWPTPGGVAVSRRITRTGRHGWRDVAQAQTVFGLDGDRAALRALLDGLRPGQPTRRCARASRRGRHEAVLSLAGVELRRGAARSLAAAVASLPVGGSLEIIAWRAPELEDGEPRLTSRHLRGVGSPVIVHALEPPVPMIAVIRVRTPTHRAPASTIAHLTAALHAEPQDWRYPESTDGRAELGLPAVTCESDADGHLVTGETTAIGLLSACYQQPGSALAGRRFTGEPARSGAVLGAARTVTGAPVDVRLDWPARRRHTFVCGRTGSGKSELLSRLVIDDLHAGRGLVLIDPHGDLVDAALAAVPRERRHEVVLIDPVDPATAAIPVLHPDLPPRQAIARLEDIIVHSGDPMLGTRSRYRRAAALVLEALRESVAIEASLCALHAVMSDVTLLRGLHSHLLPSTLLEPLMSRVFMQQQVAISDRASIFADSAARFAFDHVPRWSAEQIVRDGGILLVRLPIGELGTVDAQRCGFALLTLLLHELALTGRLPEGERSELSIIVDEAHLFTRTNGQLGSMFAQVRKFGASITIASQAPSRLGPTLSDVLTNCGTVVAMQLDARESGHLSDRHPSLPQVLPQLQKYHAVLAVDGADETDDRPLILAPTPPAASARKDGENCASAAKRRYGRPDDPDELEWLSEHDERDRRDRFR